MRGLRSAQKEDDRVKITIEIPDDGESHGTLDYWEPFTNKVSRFSAFAPRAAVTVEWADRHLSFDAAPFSMELPAIGSLKAKLVSRANAGE